VANAASAHYGPGNGEDRKAHLGANRIDHVTGDRLHQGVAHLPGNDDVGILLSGDTQVGHQRGGCDGQRVAGQVVNNQADRHQPDHPPTDAFDFHRFTLIIFRFEAYVLRPSAPVLRAL